MRCCKEGGGGQSAAGPGGGYKYLCLGRIFGRAPFEHVTTN